MEQPTDSSGIPAMPEHVCQPIQPIFGLRQAGEIWVSHLQMIIISWGFKKSDQDSQLYFYQQGTDFINIIIVVDQMSFIQQSLVH